MKRKEAIKKLRQGEIQIFNDLLPLIKSKMKFKCNETKVKGLSCLEFNKRCNIDKNGNITFESKYYQEVFIKGTNQKVVIYKYI